MESKCEFFCDHKLLCVVGFCCFVFRVVNVWLGVMQLVNQEKKIFNLQRYTDGKVLLSSRTPYGDKIYVAMWLSR